MEQSKAPGSDPAGVKFCRQVLHPLLGLSAVTCLLAVIGWTGSVTAWQHWTTVITGFVFALERAWVFAAVNPRGQERRRLIYHLAVAAAVFCVSAQLLVLHLSGSGSWSTGLHLFIQISVLVSGFASMIHHQTRFTARAVHPGWMLIGSFLAIFVVGALLLKMPRCVVPGQTCSWLDAAFTSTSAVCVTGLAVENTATFFSHTGQLVILLLIVIGALGSLVVEDFTEWVVAKGRCRLGKECPAHRLRTHTRLVLVVTATLVISGAATIMVTDFLLWNGPENCGKVLTACFHSVTARTAGFNAVPMGGIGPQTIQILMILMLIGGSPGGTAGGIRTTVIAVGLGHLWNQLRMGRRGMVAFNRTIPSENGTQALGLILLAGIWLTGNFMAFQFIEAGNGISGTRLLFELISAFATVGLSLDLTPFLTDGGKTLLIVNMFVGRIGLLTVMATLIPPDVRPASGKPTEDILLNLITIAKSRGTASSAATSHSIQKVLGVPHPDRCFEADDLLVLFGKAQDIRRMMHNEGK